MFKNKTFSVSDYEDQDYMIKKYTLPLNPKCELPLYKIDKTYPNGVTVGFVDKSSPAIYLVGKAVASDYRRGYVMETVLAEDIANPKKGCVAALSKYGNVEAISSFSESEDGKTIIIQTLLTYLSVKYKEPKDAVAGILNFAQDMGYESIIIAAYMEPGLVPNDWFIEKDEITVRPVSKKLNQKVLNVIEVERVFVGNNPAADTGLTKDSDSYCPNEIDSIGR